MDKPTKENLSAGIGSGQICSIHDKNINNNKSEIDDEYDDIYHVVDAENALKEMEETKYTRSAGPKSEVRDKID